MKTINDSRVMTVSGLCLGTSPANSGTIESVFFDEAVGQKIIVEELTTPETLKLDLLLQTKTLSDKVKSHADRLRSWLILCLSLSCLDEILFDVDGCQSIESCRTETSL